MISRRKFIKNSAAFSGASLMVNKFSTLPALATTASDYKALVCVFFAGGMDGHDCLIPYDDVSYQQWADIRASLLPSYGNDSRLLENLVALQPENSEDFGGRQFSLAPEFAPLSELFADGNLAVVGNVGPLIEPATRSQIKAGSVSLPARIASHNDQQYTWQTSSVEGAVSGWGGGLLDVLGGSSPFAAINVGGNAPFLQGDQTVPFSLASSGVSLAPAQAGSYANFSSSELAMVLEQYNDSTTTLGSLFAKEYSASQQRLLALNSELNGLLDTTNAGSSIGALGTGLSSQLEMVAKMIDLAPALAINRQVFFVKMGGGFDTHKNQAVKLPALQTQIADAMSAFYSHTSDAGVADSVTTFTASDFGRTLQPNATGTDHGWGNHHYVMGGAVNGGRIYGSVPEAALGHEYDRTSRGQLIPTTSIEQYVSSIAQWFGVSRLDLGSVFPNFGNFDSDQIQMFDVA